MFNYAWKAGVTSKSVVLRIIDSTDGTPELGVVFNTAGIDLQYRREGAASTAITEATLAALTTAWATGGFLHIGNGYYRLDVPDAAFAAGSDGVLIHGVVTGMVVIGCYVQLVAYDPFDTVRLGLTALPAAVPGAAGGVFIAGTNAATTITTGLTTTFTGNLTGSVASVSGAVGSVTGAVGSIAANGINAASIATDAIDSDAIAANGATEIADAVWNSTRAGHATGGTFGEGVASVQGNVTGSVGSVTGAVGSVTGAVGSVTGAVASVTGAVGSVSGNVGGNVTGSVGSLAAQAQTDVKTQVVATFVTDTYPEPGQGAPGVNISLKDKIGYLYKAFRNKITQTSTTLSIFNDDTTTVDQKATVSDDSTTYTRSEISTGP
jgi:hypothetical protein